MGKILTFILFFNILNCSQSQNVSKTFDDRKIVASYSYLTNKYDGKIIVSDTLTNIDIVNFSEKIAKDRNQSVSQVLDSLITFSKKNVYSNLKYPVKKLTKNFNKDGNWKFYFSKPFENYILVEVFNVKKDMNYDELTIFGNSDVYLFYFQDGKIINNYQIKLDYN